MTQRLTGKWSARLGRGCLVCTAFFLLLSPLASSRSVQKPRTKPLAPEAEHAPKPAEHLPDGAHELTQADLEAFLDGMLPMQIARDDIAGVVVSVVKDGKPFFAKGFGFSNVAARNPVAPDGTLFRPGSISKLFTWTAIMQQVEQGRLNLDRDINDYLDFEIPRTFPDPITLRSIMTHTPGFEETLQELFVEGPSELKPLDRYAKDHLPARIFPPGTVPAYSNYATSLAGYILERVSGEPWADYIENHVFRPLAMTHSTVRQPLPDNLKPLMSNGYTVAAQPAKSFEWVDATPAGSSSVTAADIDHFMIAHLQDGQYDGAQILRPETARMMHSRQFGIMPELNGMALGFYEENRNGHRIIGHAGDTQYFHSDLHLILESGVGFFISYNSAGKGGSSNRQAVWRAFLDRYFPYQVPQASVPPSASADARLVAGRYLTSRRPETTFFKVLNLLDESNVSANPDGTISVDFIKDPNGGPKKLEEIGPLLFRAVHDQDRTAFKRDDSGRLVLVPDFPVFVFQRPPLSESSTLNLPLIVASLAILVLTVLLWPIGFLIRRHYGKTLVLTPYQRRLRLVVRMVCLFDVLFALGFVVFFIMAEKNIGLLSPRLNPLLHTIQIVGWIGVVGTLPALTNAISSWWQPGRWMWSRLGDTLIALACVALAGFVYVWNMLIWSLRY